MQTGTERIEEKRNQVRQDKFKTARRVLDCLELSKNRLNCPGCSDRPVCRKIEEVIW